MMASKDQKVLKDMTEDQMAEEVEEPHRSNQPQQSHNPCTFPG